MRRGASALLFVAVNAAAVACAKMEAPPGGPPDVTAPHLISTRPEALAVLPRFRGDAEFRFDEVISEGGSPSEGRGTGDLERLVIVSPTEQQPDVRWRRNRITVRPREGWRPNRVYRVELLPGATDLRQNRSPSSGLITFSTGAPTPTATLRGSVNDWTSGSPARGALVEAMLLPDSLRYRALADSSGEFRLGPLPRGTYLVYGVLDQNHNNRRDPREAYDTVRASGDSMVAELWTYPHDSLGPRLQSVAVADSTTASLTFSQPLDPTQRLDPRDVTVRLLPDSSRVAVRSILPPSVHDSVYRAAADTTRRRADSVRARPGVKPRADSAAIAAPDTAAPRRGRRPLDTRLQLRLAEPLRPGGRYVIDVHGVRNVNGVSADARSVLAVPERAAPPAADTAAARRHPPADSAGRHAPVDSTGRHAPADSTRRPTPADSTRRPRTVPRR